MDYPKLRLAKNHKQVILPNSLDGPLHRADLIGDKSLQLYSYSTNGILQSVKYDKLSDEFKYAEIKLVPPDQVSTKSFVHFADIFENGIDVAIVKSRDGLNFYEFIEGKPNLMHTEVQFSDASGWNKDDAFIHFGRFFMDKQMMGVASLKGDKITFYGVMKTPLRKGLPAVYPLKTDLSLINNFLSKSRNELQTHDLSNRGQDHLILRSDRGLGIFDFNEENILEHVMTLECCQPKSNFEKLLFANITGSAMKDIIYISNSGFFIYQYINNQYEFIHHNFLFLQAKGFTKHDLDNVIITDVDRNNLDDIAISGPFGLRIYSYNKYDNGLYNILDESTLSSQDKISDLMQIQYKTIYDFYPSLFMAFSNRISTINLELSDIPFKSNANRIESLSKVVTKTDFVKPKITTKRRIKEMVLLRDQLDIRPLLQAVDILTGKPNFKLTLVDLKAPLGKFELHYNPKSKTSDIFGVSWSFALSYIAINDAQSVFPEDHTYYLIHKGYPRVLQKNIEASTPSELIFFIEPNSEEEKRVNLKYKMKEEFWEVDIAGDKQYYGTDIKNRKSNAVRWNIAWKNYRGPNSDAKSAMREASEWYLCSEVRDGNEEIEYYYENIEVQIPGSRLHYTREIYLKSIRDNEGNSISFHYANKTNGEYLISDVIDNNGIIRTTRAQTKYLKSYQLITEAYEQNLQFDYDIKGRERLLSAIKQQEDYIKEPVLKFTYEQHDSIWMMKAMNLPKEITVRYSYSEFKLTKNRGVTKHEVKKDTKVMYGEDFIVISHINNGDKLVVTAFNSDMTKKLMTTSVSSRNIKGHVPAQGEGYFAFSVYQEDQKELYIFQRNVKKEWPNEPQIFKYPLSTSTSFGRDFMIAAGASKVDIMEPDRSGTWKIVSSYTSANNNFYLSVSRNKFVVYDDADLYLGYKTTPGFWEYKKIYQVKGVISTKDATLNSFNLMKLTKEDIRGFFNINSLQFVNNIVLLYTWRVQNWQMYSDIYTFILDENKKVALHKMYKIKQDNLREFETENNHDGTIFTIGYNFINNLYQAVCKTFRGRFMDEIEKEREKLLKQQPRFADDINKSIDDTKTEVIRNVTENVKQSLLLDVVKYMLELRVNNITVNDKIYSFTGNNWKVEDFKINKNDSELSMDLGPRFVLKQNEAKSGVDLYRKKSKKHYYVLNMEVKKIQHINIKYPSYISYSNYNNITQIIKFTDDGEDIAERLSLPSNEINTIWSSSQVFVTELKESKKDCCSTLVFRDLTKPLTDIVLNTNEILYNEDYTRKSGYEYDQNSTVIIGDDVYYKKSFDLPGNDKIKFGHKENYFDINGSGESYQSVYNGRGRQVKKILKTNADDKKQNEIRKDIQEQAKILYNSTLVDLSRSLEISQFYPYQIQDEEVGYFGFENYENDNIGKSSKWKYNPKSVIQKSFALTGENYLQLKGTSLEGIFQPKNQNLTFIASCWARPHETTFKMGAFSPNFKVVMADYKGHEFYGTISEVKYRIGDWFYLETIVEYTYVKAILAKWNSNNTDSQNVIAEKDITMIIRVSSSPNATLDVDHVRVFPNDHKFLANVYEGRRISAKIHSNGLTTRHIHDVLTEDKGHVNAYGILDKFQTISKAANISSYTSSIEIQPEYGIYEDFSVSSFQNMWNIFNSDNWSVAPGQLLHEGDNSDKIDLNAPDLLQNSFAISFKYDLPSGSSEVQIKILDLFILTRLKQDTKIIIQGKSHETPANGELLWVMENKHCFLWVNGNLYLDDFLPNFNITSVIPFMIKGRATIYEVTIMKNPRIKVTYSNSLGEKIQDVILETFDTAIVQEFLYETLGRQSLTTEPVRVRRNTNLLGFHKGFVQNGNPGKNNSVWATGKLEGLINEYNAKNKFYGFGGKIYADDALENKIAEGRPGKDYTIHGKYSKKYSSETDITYVALTYPKHRGYSYQIEHSSDGEVQTVSVLNSKDHLVAKYIRFLEAKDHLTTYEVNDEGRLLKMLPPLYHDKEQTILNSGLNSSDNKSAASNLEESITYDAKGNILSRKTPDTTKVEYIRRNNLLYFTIFYKRNGSIEKVLYFQYDSQNKLVQTGILKDALDRNQLEAILKNGDDLPENTIYQRLNYGKTISEPMLREAVKRTITMNGEEPLIEETILDLNENVATKRIILTLPELEEPTSIEIRNKYLVGKLQEIHYPHSVNGEKLIVIYEYNKLGQVIGVGTPKNSKQFAAFKYDDAGLIISEKRLPGSEEMFEREYSYNEPKFLTKLKDKYLTENISYTSDSYGGRILGDGTITKTEFLATWHQFADERNLKLNKKSFISPTVSAKTSEICFTRLKEKSYIDEEGHQAKVFHTDEESDLPIACSKGVPGRYIAQTLGSKGFPKQYGHTYDYGNHKEMTKAKYFVGESVAAPLQPQTFNKIKDITTAQSIKIWKILQNKGYIIENKDTVAVKHIHGKKGRSFVRSELFSDLRKVNKDYGSFSSLIGKQLLNSFTEAKFLTVPELEKSFSLWIYPRRINKQLVLNIWNMLRDKNYLQEPLTEEFQNSLREFNITTVRGIVGCLTKHFATQLGEAEFDVESYDIDANGNHKQYYTGFERYEMEYSENNNQIISVNRKSFAKVSRNEKYEMKHDCYGNVIRAMHKGIKDIEYEPVSNRISLVKKTNGSQISFKYDSMGNRVSKRVMNANGTMLREIQYIRDAVGRPLIERELINAGDELPLGEIITVYVHGPRGLIGFFRSGEFFSIISDHEGSTRLVLQGGRVVAAYDYLPYGNTMRTYDPKGLGVRYRYTGHEWDAELDLYNFRARFYDPDLGRFYQVDPQSQYPSPYKFAGNSPVSLVDPNGEFVFTLIAVIVGAAVGAYLGGAGANNSWNLLKWDWTSTSTWLGIIQGGIAGGSLPLGFAGSVGFFTSLGAPTWAAVILTTGAGVAGSYLTIASSQNDWNPAKWNVKSPVFWNALFQGFGSGSGFFSGLKNAAHLQGLYDTFKKLNILRKFLYIGVKVTPAGLFFALNGIANGWDVSNPAFWTGTLGAILTGATDVPKFLKNSKTFFHENLVSVWGGLKNKQYQQAFKAGAKLFLGTSIAGVSVYLQGDSSTDGEWSFSSIATYEGILTGILSSHNYVDTISNVYQKGKTYLDYKNSKRINKIMQERAKQAVDIFKQKHSDIAKSYEGKEIPLSVHNKGDLFTIVISAGDKPGMVMYSDRDGKSVNYFIDNKKNIAGQPVLLNDDVKLNNEINVALEAKRHEIKTINEVEFSSDVQPEIRRIISEADAKISLNIDESTLKQRAEKIENLRDVIRKKGLIEMTDIESAVAESYQLVKEPYQMTRENVLNDLVILTAGDEPAKIKLVSQISDINDINEVDAKINKAKEKRQQQLTEIEDSISKIDSASTKSVAELNSRNELKSLLEVWEKRTNNWDPINCAETRVVLAASRAPAEPSARFSKRFKKFFGMKPQEYLARYDASSGLVPVERCVFCKITTKHIPNVVTDPEWNENLQNLKNKLKLLSIREAIDNGKPQTNRPKRSVMEYNSSTLKFPSKEGLIYDQQEDHKISMLSSWIDKPMQVFTQFLHRVTKSEPLEIRGEFVPLLISDNQNSYRNDSHNISVDPSQLQVNGSVMLLDVLVRKFTEKKFVNTNSTMDFVKAQVESMNLIEKLEDSMKDCYGVDVNEFIDVSALQADLYNSFATENYKKIPVILTNYLNVLLKELMIDDKNNNVDEIIDWILLDER